VLLYSLGDATVASGSRSCVYVLARMLDVSCNRLVIVIRKTSRPNYAAGTVNSFAKCSSFMIRESKTEINGQETRNLQDITTKMK
jgi:hypothetical protein